MQKVEFTIKGNINPFEDDIVNTILLCCMNDEYLCDGNYVIHSVVANTKEMTFEVCLTTYISDDVQDPIQDVRDWLVNDEFFHDECDSKITKIILYDNNSENEQI